MKSILHIVPGLNQPWSGISVAAKLLANEQGAELADAHGVEARTVARFDEIWVHSTWSRIVWRACRLAQSAGKRLVRMTHGNLDPARRKYHPLRKWLAGSVERYFLRQADLIVATCQAEADWIRSYEPHVKSIEVTNLKRFFDLDCAERAGGRKRDGRVDVERWRNDGYAERELHLLYLGRRHPLKGIEYLEAAVSHLHLSTSTRLNIKLRIVSNATGKELDDVWDWCDVLVLPTLSDNFGLVVAEALGRGKRVITTDGAPAWGDGNTYGGRLTYLRGYRDGSPAERIRLLKTAIDGLERR